MKRTILTLSTLALVLGLQAQTFTSGKMQFGITEPDTKEVQLLRGNDTTVTTLVVPATVQYKQGKKKPVTYRVTSIASDAFRGKTHLVSVTLPDAIRSLDDSLFMGCTALTTVTFSDSLEHLGKAVFHGCKSLEQFALPDRKSTRLNSSHTSASRMPSSA